MDFAEVGFIYGLPIVMNYAIMYEYAVARNSGQFSISPMAPAGTVAPARRMTK